jgi:hypothetical protein
MNDTDYFPELNLEELETLISGHIERSSWLNDIELGDDEYARLKQAKIIDRIILYSGWDPDSLYVIVAVLNKVVKNTKSVEHRNYKYFLNWADSSCLHIQDWLPRVYKKSPHPEEYFTQWSWFNATSNEELPTDFVFSKKHWILYSPTTEKNDRDNKWTCGKDFMAKWSVSACELYQIIKDCELPCYKDIHESAKYGPGEIDFNYLSEKLDGKTSKWNSEIEYYEKIIPPLYFKKSEVEKCEKEKGLGKYSTTAGDTPKEIVSENDKVSKIQEQKVFQCKPGTKWEDIKITLLENDVVRIDTPQGSGRFSYHELGMSDNRTRNKKPTVLWHLLKIFATNQGIISRKNIRYDPKLPDTCKRLNKHLQKIFKIQGSIFTDHYKSEKGYKTKIFFSNETLAI